MSDGRFGGAPVPVALPGGCQCPGTPHERDEVYLLPRLTWDGGVAADAVLSDLPMTTDGRVDTGRLAAMLCRAYLENQVSGWNLTDENGPIPYSSEKLLSDWDIARVVGDKADDLYSDALLAPLVAAASTSSQRGRTAPSTSARTPSARRRRKP